MGKPQTAEELRAALSQVITDKGMVEQVVSQQFPPVVATYRCGHPRTPENKRWSQPGCRTCDNARRKARRARGDREPHHANYYPASRAVLGSPIHGEEFTLREKDMEQGSRLLLEALWKYHQRILLVAEATGRKVVRL